MNLHEVLSDSTIKIISEYFNGDEGLGSSYSYRTGGSVIDMYTHRFGYSEYPLGASRWYYGQLTMEYMAEEDKLSEYFTNMLSFRNIKKEHPNVDDEEVCKIRFEAIKRINSFLFQDDCELTEAAGRLFFAKVDDKTNLIGEGGFAQVYRIPDTNTVIKKLKDEFKGDSSIVSRFKNEFVILTDNLKGVPGIIKAFEFDPKSISYTMEYCETDLKQYILGQYKSFSEQDKMSLILDILDVMEDVHERKVLHRDLSPKNIFIKNGKPIIADFGLGKAIDSSGRTYVTVDTSYQGTLEYCDLRQFQGLGFADKQSDIYSLGKIINFIMTKNPEDFNHSLSIITTIATQTSLDARYHSITEMIIKIKQSKHLDATGNYATECVEMIDNGMYEPSMDEYLLSYEGEDLILQLYNPKFIKAYWHLFDDLSYDGVLVDRFSLVHQRLEKPIGLTFANLDNLGVNLIKLLMNRKELSPAIKEIAGKCIFDITCGINRWSVQKVFAANYKKIESLYIQDTIDYFKKNNVI